MGIEADGNLLMTPTQVCQLLRARCEKAGSQSAFAREIGLPQPYINAVIRGRRPPSEYLCDILGIEAIITYRKVKTDGELK